MNCSIRFDLVRRSVGSQTELPDHYNEEVEYSVFVDPMFVGRLGVWRDSNLDYEVFERIEILSKSTSLRQYHFLFQTSVSEAAPFTSPTMTAADCSLPAPSTSPRRAAPRAITPRSARFRNVYQEFVKTHFETIRDKTGT
jgi:hypothetical protein